LHSNYQIRELAMIVAGSSSSTGPPNRARGGSRRRLTRDYECSNAKLSSTLRFVPRLSVLERSSHLLEHVDHEDRAKLTDPRTYNIRWPRAAHAGSSQSRPVFASVL